MDVTLDISDQPFPDLATQKDDQRELIDLPQSIDIFGNYPPFLNQTFNDSNYTNWTAAPLYAHYVEANLPSLKTTTLFTVKGECRNCQLSDTGTFTL